ncbi:MAG: 4-alpha-glucanotransferase [Erysipelotrichaceae bacterium]|nr:4-alpha-glucanotransferase [Erysipelotrichaceae bacterium]
MKRSSGILCPISSLPSNYGIGTLGKEAYKFIDFLVKANQTYWQVLPIGPTGYGDSPYQSFSSFAGNPYFIDLDELVKDGLLSKKDLKDLKVENENYINYGDIYNTRFPLLLKAYHNGKDKFAEEFGEFKNNNAKWLNEYSLFMALKKHFDNKCWINWEDENARLRREDTLNYYRDLLSEDIEYYSFIQFLFFRQFEALKAYAKEKEIQIIGDLPIYVPLDSCDVWANPECFELNDQNIPTAVAGVPPDYFTPEGQLWGNPLYNWEYMKTTGYKWWIDRVEATAKLFDVVRIDHFRGFDSYWSVPYGDTTAINGHWVTGPGMEFVGVLKNWFHDVEFVAEDLGYHTESVQKLLDDSTFPGMKVLQFGFDSREPSNHAPHNYTENSICYVGTHDNSTCMGWKKAIKKSDLDFVYKYLNLHKEDNLVWSLTRTGMMSVSKLFVGCIWDYFELDDSARINAPGSLGNNWKWRMSKNQYDNKLAKQIAELVKMYERGR